MKDLCLNDEHTNTRGTGLMCSPAPGLVAPEVDRHAGAPEKFGKQLLLYIFSQFQILALLFTYVAGGLFSHVFR